MAWPPHCRLNPALREDPPNTLTGAYSDVGYFERNVRSIEAWASSSGLVGTAPVASRGSTEPRSANGADPARRISQLQRCAGLARCTRPRSGASTRRHSVLCEGGGPWRPQRYPLGD